MKSSKAKEVIAWALLATTLALCVATCTVDGWAGNRALNAAGL
jgi:hypothetical protein